MGAADLDRSAAHYGSLASRTIYVPVLGSISRNDTGPTFHT